MLLLLLLRRFRLILPRLLPSLLLLFFVLFPLFPVKFFALPPGGRVLPIESGPVKVPKSCSLAVHPQRLHSKACCIQVLHPFCNIARLKSELAQLVQHDDLLLQAKLLVVLLLPLVKWVFKFVLNRVLLCVLLLALQQLLHDQLTHKLVRVVICSKQEQRLLKLLDVKLEEMESLPESELVSKRGGSRSLIRTGVLQDIHQSHSSCWRPPHHPSQLFSCFSKL